MTEITRRTLEESFVKFDVINTIACTVEDELRCTLHGIQSGKSVGIDLGQIDSVDGDIDMITSGTSKHIWIKTDFKPKEAHISYDEHSGDTLTIR